VKKLTIKLSLARANENIIENSLSKAVEMM
jgi:hypothetical protein